MFPKNPDKNPSKKVDISVDGSEGAIVAGNNIVSNSIHLRIEKILVSDASASDLKASLVELLAWLKEYREHSQRVQTENTILQDENKRLKKCLRELLAIPDEQNG